MPIGVFADKLFDLTNREGGAIAEQWHKSVSTNPRTPAFRSLPKDELVRQAAALYKNLKQMYFSEKAFDEVAQYLERSRYVEDLLARRVPLAEIIYSLILMRRYIWLHADTQTIFFDTSYDVQQQTDSINRTVLVFDYIIYLAIQRYEKLTSPGKK